MTTPATPFADRLQRFDSAVLDALAASHAEKRRLTDRLERLAEEREHVSQAVYDRVHADYTTRLAAIAEQARPLEERVSGERREAEALLAETRAALVEARLDHEELELRHRLGEFEDGAYHERVEAVGERLSAREREHAQAQEIWNHFARLEGEAPPSEAASGSAAVVPAADTVSPPAEVPPDTGAATAAGAVPPPPPPEIPPADVTAETAFSPPPPPSAATTGSTAAGASTTPPVDLHTTAPTAVPPPPSPVGATVAPPAAPVDSTVALDPGFGSSGATRAFRPATLVSERPINGRTDLPLEPLTTIGRVRQNQIQLDDSAVSRRHAEVTLTREGYRLRDLGSGNGTFVNGKPIVDVALADGDRILIGGFTLTFRQPQD